MSTKTSKLTVTRRDERADLDPIRNPDQVRFGFIEFNDGTRVGYDSRAGVWFAHNAWGETNTDHIRSAWSFLNHDEPGWHKPGRLPKPPRARGK